MVTADEKRIFCSSLGIAPEQVKVERIPHPTKRAHMIFRVSHPRFGEATASLEHDAWLKFFDVAEKQAPPPDRCQAKTKKGKPCSNAPQKGELYCGPHLDQIKRQT